MLLLDEWEKLSSMVSLDDLRATDLAGDHPQAHELKELLRSIRRRTITLNSRLSETSAKTQVLDGVSPELTNFFRDIILPSRLDIEEAAFRVTDPEGYELFWDFYISAGSFYPQRRDTYDTFVLAQNWWSEHVEGRHDWDVDEDNIKHLEQESDYAWEVIETGYFQPDLWRQNQKELRPIMLPTSDDRLSPQLSRRVRNIYLSFIFGNWLAAIALTRSVLEYCILDVASDLRIEISNPKDASRTAGLSLLIRRTSEKLDGLEVAMEHIRVRGDAVMHPNADRKLVELLSGPLARDASLSCIRHLGLVVERLYAARRGL